MSKTGITRIFLSLEERIIKFWENLFRNNESLNIFSHGNVPIFMGTFPWGY